MIFLKYLFYLKTLQQLENKGPCYFHVWLETEKNEVDLFSWLLHQPQSERPLLREFLQPATRASVMEGSYYLFRKALVVSFPRQ